MGPEKRKKAESLGIEIKSEEDFLKMIGNTTDNATQNTATQGVLEFEF